jgi:phosphatidylglycerol:prolipoprotein diacylglycerol transferase
MAYVVGFLAWFYGLGWFRKLGWSRLSDNQVSELLLYTVLGVLLGGRLGYCLLYDWAETVRNPIGIIAFWNGGIRGMASHGGIAGALLGFLFWARKNRADGWAVADNAAVLAPVGIFLGRIANFINGELWGRITNVPWAVIFPEAGSQPRHPSQLYEAALNLLLCGGLIVWQARRPQGRGQLFGLYLMAYSGIRSFTEYFRGDYGFQSAPTAGVFTPGQSTSVLIFAAGLALWFLRRPRSGSTGPHVD